MNIIWNAASDYGFRPDFRAFLPDGKSDFYFNTVIGLAAKWFDRNTLSLFFSSYAGNDTAGDIDAIVWLAIENSVYEKEVPSRPVLGMLRREHADMFFRRERMLLRGDMTTPSPRVYEQQKARWASVSGRPAPDLRRHARELYSALLIPGSADTDELIRRLKSILVIYMSVRSFRIERAVPLRRRGSFDRIMKREIRHVDSLFVRNRGVLSDTDVHSQSFFAKHAAQRSERDREYICETFGACIYGKKDMHILENNLCTGNHENCRLWISEGGTVSSSRRDRLGVKAVEDACEQNRKNEAFFEKNRRLMAASIKSLSASLETILASFAKPLPVRSRRGALDTPRAYRLPAVNDPNVFTKPGDEAEYDISVDILLDASASRLEDQEIIAAQSYVIAMSLEKCGIPVQVMSFRSLRGYTVIQILKRYSDSRGKGIFRYFAGGWNRDGLALRIAGNLIRKPGNGTHRILLVMTDAHPNDSTPLPPEEGSVFRREYDGAAAVGDTARAVSDIKADGVSVAAVYLGIPGRLESLHAIYGKEYIRVARIGDLACGISSLVQMILREMKN